MSNDQPFQPLFEQLKNIIDPYANKLICAVDDPTLFYLETTHIMKSKKPLFFGSVKINKNYVSYHLMPVYVFPELLADISPELKRRMQGKSCFNFKATDQALFDELAALTKVGYQQYSAAGYIKTK